jgi:hypothetical protein
MKRFLVFSASTLALVVAGVVIWFGPGVYRSITVRQPNSYAMQSAGQLIIEHLRRHSGAWPKSWAELRETCAISGMQILAKTPDAEIAELKKRVEIDWSADPARLRDLVHQGDVARIAVVKLRSGRRDWFVGAEPNQMIGDYLKETAESDTAHGSPPWRSETNQTTSAPGSLR